MTQLVAEKITELYAGNEGIDFCNSSEAIQQTVCILASGGLRSSFAYTGTAGITDLGGLLVIKPNLVKRIYAVIYIDWMDEYNIDFVSVGSNAKVVKNWSGIYCDLPETVFVSGGTI